MFTDMIGYTALGQENESLSLALVNEQRRLIRPILKKHSGREVKTIGDAFFVEFPSALDAVRCAYDIQREIRQFNISQLEGQRLHLRIGVHLGDVLGSKGDVSGDAVNIASRIQPLAEDGGVCLTRQVYDQVQNKFELPLNSLGMKTLKNVGVPQEIFKMTLPWIDQGDMKEKFDTRRIAVLPFANMSPDPNDEFFADGLTEEMITELSRVPSLRVIGRTSAMVYKNANKSLQQIGRELRVGSLLEGSIRKAGNKLRITAQLIDAGTEEHLWADKFDKEMGDIFTIQSDIAANVARALQLRLIQPSGPRSEQGENLQAYTLYLKGRFLWNQRSEHSIREALKLFETVVKAYPDYARAYSGIADCYTTLLNRAETPWSEIGPRARAASEKAIELDGSLPEAYASLGVELSNEMDWEGAERELKRAIELNPGYAPAHLWYSFLLRGLGRFSEGHAEVLKAEEADPLSPIILVQAGYTSWLKGHEEEAMEKWNRGLEVAPAFAELHLVKGSYYTWKKMRTEAMAELEQIKSLPEKEIATRAAFGFAWWGEPAEGEVLRKKFLDEPKKSGTDLNRIAWLSAALGDVDKFYEYAIRCIDHRTFYPENLRENHFLEKMRKDPRYAEFMKKWKVPA